LSVTVILILLALVLPAPTGCFANEAMVADANSSGQPSPAKGLAGGESQPKPDEKLLGDESDGSRAVPIHLVPLYPENEDGKKGFKIAGNDEILLPFSTRWTCGACHSYAIISSGRHFNAVDANVAPGRTGQPWILVDASTDTQIPLSYRSWHRAFKPEQVGLTPRQFTKLFGRQAPGGGAGELESQDPNEFMREFVSGKLEINCLACHNADPGQDQAEYAVQIARENFRWAAAASCEFARVRGSAIDMPDTYDTFMPMPLDDPKKIPPRVSYREGAFDQDNSVFFDITRKVPNERCYFCHSNLDVSSNSPEKWAADEDVHLTAGLKCVDCHRNGIDHNITRGYEGEQADSKNPLTAVSSCEGCHLGQKNSSKPACLGEGAARQGGGLAVALAGVPIEGRLGAPVPEHRGIPPVHFDKLSCTSCHSGPWPGEKTILTKTARAHGLGIQGINKSPEVLPHIETVVFAKQSNGKIAPHKLLWPAFWGTIKDGKVTPINLEVVRKTVRKILAGQKLPSSGDWRTLTAEHIAEGLDSLQKEIEGEAVYISGGKLYKIDNKGKLIAVEHDAAKPYLWPIAHDVRPAAQSLGVRSCRDCHATNAPFFFGAVAVDSPIDGQRDLSKEMIEFQDINRSYARAFAFSFIFHSFIKVVALCSSAILAAVLILYVFQGLACVLNLLSGKKQ
jgi:hypothetical protein